MNKLRILSLERMGTDANTTVIGPGIAGDSHPGRGMRVRVQFDDRALLVDERRSSITIGRAVDNDLVVKDHLISRRHVRIEISCNKFVILIDQSTNGTFVQPDDEEELFIRQDIFQLRGRGMIGLGRPPEEGSPHTIHFSCEQVLTGQAQTSDLQEIPHRGQHTGNR